MVITEILVKNLALPIFENISGIPLLRNNNNTFLDFPDCLDSEIFHNNLFSKTASAAIAEIPR